jgi:Domain of Unknown Function (DUF1080)
MHYVNDIFADDLFGSLQSLFLFIYPNIIYYMKKKLFVFISILLAAVELSAQDTAVFHPTAGTKGWKPLFNKTLDNAIFPDTVWTVSNGVLTASRDEAIWSKKAYRNFAIDLEFKNAEGTNSGVIVHATDIKEWIPHSVEIQIADDYSAKWSSVRADWQCAAIFGHQAATQKTVKPAGEWNRFTITCIGPKIWVVLNSVLVNSCDRHLFTSATTNPDGSPIPEWLNNPMAGLPLEGRIGLQGKHAGAPIYFRNIRVKEL